MSSTHLSVRVPNDVPARLAHHAKRSGMTRSALVQRYLEEGLRMDEHPAILFRDGPAGRRPGLAGSGLDVWEVVETVADNDGSVQKAAEYLRISVGRVEAAMRYYCDHREEIDEWIAENDAMAARLESEHARIRSR